MLGRRRLAAEEVIRKAEEVASKYGVDPLLVRNTVREEIVAGGTIYTASARALARLLSAVVGFERAVKIASEVFGVSRRWVLRFILRSSQGLGSAAPLSSGRDSIAVQAGRTRRGKQVGSQGI